MVVIKEVEEEEDMELLSLALGEAHKATITGEATKGELGEALRGANKTHGVAAEAGSSLNNRGAHLPSNPTIKALLVEDTTVRAHINVVFGIFSDYSCIYSRN